MITKEELQEQLHSTETYRVERTVSTGNMDKFQEAICAFANGSPDPEFNVNLFTAFSVIVREPKIEVDVIGGENLPGDTTQKTSNDGVEKSVEKRSKNELLWSRVRHQISS